MLGQLPFSNFHSSFRGEGTAEENSEVFVECIDKSIDVFTFLSLDRSDTSVSSSSSCMGDDLSCCSTDETVYFDATFVLEREGLELLEDDIGIDASSSEEVECIFPPPTSSLEESRQRKLQLPEYDDDERSLRSEGANPIGFAVHVANNIWQGSKKTPVGFAVNLTEGIFGHLVGIIQNKNNDTHPDTGNWDVDENFQRAQDESFLEPNENEGNHHDSNEIAEPDPLDASEFLLKAQDQSMETSAILLDSSLEQETTEMLANSDLRRRLDISISSEESSSDILDKVQGKAQTFGSLFDENWASL